MARYPRYSMFPLLKTSLQSAPDCCRATFAVQYSCTSQLHSLNPPKLRVLPHRNGTKVIRSRKSSGLRDHLNCRQVVTILCQLLSPRQPLFSSVLRWQYLTASSRPSYLKPTSSVQVTLALFQHQPPIFKLPTVPSTLRSFHIQTFR